MNCGVWVKGNDADDLGPVIVDIKLLVRLDRDAVFLGVGDPFSCRALSFLPCRHEVGELEDVGAPIPFDVGTFKLEQIFRH